MKCPTVAEPAHIAVDRGLLHFDTTLREPAVAFLRQPECRIKEEAQMGRFQDLEIGAAQAIRQIGETITAIVQEPLVVNVVEIWPGGHLNYRYAPRLENAMDLVNSPRVVLDVLKNIEQHHGVDTLA